MIEWPFPDHPPREVQLKALEKSKGKYGFAFFMRQRLGKTWTAYAEYYNLKKEGEVDWCVIICPNTLKEQWKNAIEEVDEYTPICIYNASQKSKVDYFFKRNKRGGVFIINYESVRAFMNDKGWMNFDPLRTYLVADESTKIKDPTAKMSKACHELSSLCTYTRVLTGKPTANSNADLWSQFKFIKCTHRNFFQHKYYFCIMGGYQGRTIVRNINTEKLQYEMAPHCYIADDKYIQGFEKYYEPLRKVHLTKEQLIQYKQMEKQLIMELQDGVEITAPIALVKYLRLQQISSGIAGDPDGVQHNTINPRNNPRIQVVRDILDNEINHKVIIPCRFKLSIDNLYDILSSDGHKVVKLVGGMSGPDLEHAKKLFNEGDHNVMLAQLQVLSFGHTLPGPDSCPCDSMIYYENNFSLLDRMQSESRPEKFERKGTISYYDMFASKMDRYIIEKLREKEEASLALMGYARRYGFRPDEDKGDDDDKGTKKDSAETFQF